MNCGKEQPHTRLRFGTQIPSSLCKNFTSLVKVCYPRSGLTEPKFKNQTWDAVRRRINAGGATQNTNEFSTIRVSPYSP